MRGKNAGIQAIRFSLLRIVASAHRFMHRRNMSRIYSAPRMLRRTAAFRNHAFRTFIN
jgi:hypothetical protein